VLNRETGVRLKGVPIPGALLELMQGGGVFPILEERGLIERISPTKIGAE